MKIKYGKCFVVIILKYSSNINFVALLYIILWLLFYVRFGCTGNIRRSSHIIPLGKIGMVCVCVFFLSFVPSSNFKIYCIVKSGNKISSREKGFLLTDIWFDFRFTIYHFCTDRKRFALWLSWTQIKSTKQYQWIRFRGTLAHWNLI